MNSEIKQYAELTISMSTDFLLGKLDENTYANNLKLISKCIDDKQNVEKESNRQTAEEAVTRMINEKLHSGEYVIKTATLENGESVNIIDKKGDNAG